MQRSNTIAIGISVLGLLCLVGAYQWSHLRHPPESALVAEVQRGAEIETALQSAPVTATSTATLRIPIFIYHNIRPDYPGETDAVKAFTTTPELLEQQLAYLTEHGYTTISLDDLATDLRTGTTSPIAKPVVLTFDDGWQNEYTYGFPLLKKYHLTATFFIFTNPIGKNPHYLTWDEVREMNAAGMTIGDHTLSHPLLSHLTPEQLQKEVVGGKQAIEKEIGKPVTDFASPFGYTNDALTALLTQSGFTTGRTTYKGAYHTTADQYRLTGFLVHRDMKDFIYILEQSK